MKNFLIFWYLILPNLNKSILHFGSNAVVSNAVVSGSGVISTPLVKHHSNDHYYLILEAISISKKKFPIIGGSSSTSKGSIIIDSGTTMSIFPQQFYSNLESAMVSAVRVKRVKDPVTPKFYYYYF